MTAAVNQKVQWRWTGELTAHAFTSLKATANVKTETDQVRPAGDRFGASTYLKKEHTEGTVEGVVDYSEINALLEWALTAGTPTTFGGVTTTPYQVGPGRTRTLEVGDSSHAAQIADCFLTSLAFEFGRSAGDATVKADMIGGKWSDNEGLTANPVSSPANPATAGEVTVAIADTRSGLINGTVGSVLKASVSLGSLRDPLWLLNGAPSISGSTEKAVDGTVELLMVADANGRIWLDRLRGGNTYYVRIDVKNNGDDPAIRMEFAVQAAEHSREEADAVYAAKTVLNIVRDADGFSHAIEVRQPAVVED